MVAAVALGWLAMLCKEGGVTVFATLVVYDMACAWRLVSLQPTRWAGVGSTFVVRVAVLALAAIAAVGSRMWMMGFTPPSFPQHQNPASHADSALTRTLT